MSGIITEPMFLQVFPQMAPKNKSGAIQALVVAIYEIGCLLGSFFIIGFGDKLGRRRAVLLGTLIMLIGTAIQATSFSLAQLIVGRIVTGCGNGMNTSSIPVWYDWAFDRSMISMVLTCVIVGNPKWLHQRSEDSSSCSKAH